MEEQKRPLTLESCKYFFKYHYKAIKIRLTLLLFKGDSKKTYEFLVKRW